MVVNVMEENGNKKRVRDDDLSELDSSEVKRVRDDLLGFLDDSDFDPVSLDLDSVMKSFEEQISADSSSSPVVFVDLKSDSGESQPELGYLLEASDDELGLPPSSVREEQGGKSNEVSSAELVLVDAAESGGDNGLWGFEDPISSYDSFGLGIVENYNTVEYAAFDDGLFEYSNVCFDSSDFSDYACWPGTKPAE